MIFVCAASTFPAGAATGPESESQLLVPASVTIDSASSNPCVSELFLATLQQTVVTRQSLSLSASSKPCAAHSYIRQLTRCKLSAAAIFLGCCGQHCTQVAMDKSPRCKVRRAKHAPCEIRQQLFYTTEDKQVALSTTSACRATAPRV